MIRLTCLLCMGLFVVAKSHLNSETLAAQIQIDYPYNPDDDGDGLISIEDLMGVLAVYSTEFEPSGLMVDGMPLEEFLAGLVSAVEALQAQNPLVGVYLNEGNQLVFTFADGSSFASPALEGAGLPSAEGLAPGQFIRWNGEAWQVVPAQVGCADETACNFDSNATVHDPERCQYLDACGVCDGPGPTESCGCEPIADGACDCEGNQLDALGVCGGGCAADADGDGICDDGDSCVGQADACGVCNGPGAIYDCGCSPIPEGDCDCTGTPDADGDGVCDDVDDCVGTPDAIGVCNGTCVTDADGDGVCDDDGGDPCDGTLDVCGVCNGPGPVYDCGCNPLPEGSCDCAGNEPDEEGNCADYLVDADGDGIYDEVVDACLGQTSYSYQGHDYGLVVIDGKCWFKENLAATSYRDGTPLSEVEDEASWNALMEEGAYCTYGSESIYGLLYNGFAAARDVCPQYWDVPAASDWDALVNALGGAATAGGAMKAAGTSLWSAPNTDGTNSSGFSALPAGERALTPDDFNGLQTQAIFWAHPVYTEIVDVTATVASVRMLSHNSGGVTVQTHSSLRGHSIRCLRADPVLGCTNINYMEYSPTANVNDGSCATEAVLGCTDANFIEFDPEANVDDGSCDQLVGCEDGMTAEYAGYAYTLKTIGNQCWFAENLRTAVYRNGDAIPNLQSSVEWQNATYGAWADYGNNSVQGEVYGKLYNWYAVADSRGLCPSGWHVPTDGEYMTLEMALGMGESEANSEGMRGSIAAVGSQLKSSPSDNPAWNGTNTSGFSALAGGYRFSNGYFNGEGDLGGFWSSSPNGTNAWYRGLSSGNAGVYRNVSNQRGGGSVRCVRDE